MVLVVAYVVVHDTLPMRGDKHERGCHHRWHQTRDGHLRSNDFFGAEDHPTISFRSTAVRPAEGETHWKVDGDLTIRGVTRPVTVEVEFLGGGTDPWGNQRIGFSGVAPEVNREDWGLTWNAPLETGGFLLSKSVRLEIEAELVRK